MAKKRNYKTSHVVILQLPKCCHNCFFAESSAPLKPTLLKGSPFLKSEFVVVLLVSYHRC